MQEQPTIYTRDENGHVTRQTLPLARMIVTATSALRRCEEREEQGGKTEWTERWRKILADCESLLPHGSGIDRGTKINREKTTNTRIVLHVAFHHMDENGYYDGWSDYSVTAVPAFGGIDVRVKGQDRNGMRDYLADVYRDALNELVAWTEQGVERKNGDA